MRVQKRVRFLYTRLSSSSTGFHYKFKRRSLELAYGSARVKGPKWRSSGDVTVEAPAPDAVVAVGGAKDGQQASVSLDLASLLMLP